MSMYPELVNSNNYHFVSGLVIELDNSSVTLLTNNGKQIKAFFDPSVTEFWNGGLTNSKTLNGKIGDSGKVAAYTDSTGKLLVDIIYFNHVKTTGKVINRTTNNLIIQPTNSDKTLILQLDKNAITFHDDPVDINNYPIGSTIDVIGNKYADNAINAIRLQEL